MNRLMISLVIILLSYLVARRIRLLTYVSKPKVTGERTIIKQKIGKFNRFAAYVFYADTVFVVMVSISLLIAYVFFHEQVLEPLLVFGVMALVFLGISILLYYVMNDAQYLEGDHYFTISKHRKKRTVFFDEIIAAYIYPQLSTLLIIDEMGRYSEINLLWYAPERLLDYIIENNERFCQGERNLDGQDIQQKIYRQLKTNDLEAFQRAQRISAYKIGRLKPHK